VPEKPDWWERVFLASLPALIQVAPKATALSVVSRACQFADTAMIRLAMEQDELPATWTTGPTDSTPMCADGYRHHRWSEVGVCVRCGYSNKQLHWRAKAHRNRERKLRKVAG
jgi:Zn ribbon nucleic-acid-binding protein